MAHNSCDGHVGCIVWPTIAGPRENLGASSRSLAPEAGVQGVQAHPQKFLFGENPGKIRGNLGRMV